MSSGADGHLAKGSAAVHREFLNLALTSMGVGFGHGLDETLYGNRQCYVFLPPISLKHSVVVFCYNSYS